jgi:hypothetical protein
LRPESANDLDYVDFDDSDEDELDAYSYAARRNDDMADAVSIASEDVDGDADSTSSTRRRKTLEDLLQSMKSLEVFKKRKAEKSKVSFVSFRMCCNAEKLTFLTEPSNTL